MNQLLPAIITQRIDYIKDRGEYRDALDHRLVQWLKEAGFLSYSITNAIDVTKGQKYYDDWISTIKPSLIVLSGGNNLQEYPTRDNVEKYLLDFAKKQNLPVLGICRGMQLMANYFGVELEPVINHVGAQHTLTIDKEQISVNSYHNYRLRSVPEDFMVIARADDGTIEVMQHHTFPWLGFMWHPEREQPFQEWEIKKIQKLVYEAKP